MDPFDPMNPMQSQYPMSMFRGAAQPQAQRISQAFQPPVTPAFMQPQNQVSPMLEALKNPLSAGQPGPGADYSKLTAKPSGKILTGDPMPAKNYSDGGGMSDNPRPKYEDNANLTNPWLNPQTLAGMGGNGQAPQKPGDGLWSFLGSGAPQAFRGIAGLQGPTPNGPSLDTVANGSGGLYAPGDRAQPSSGAFGEPGSVVNMLTGGSADPKSAMAGLFKLFGGFGGF